MKKDFIFNKVNNLKGVGPQLSKYLKKRNDIGLSISKNRYFQSKPNRTNKILSM